MYSKGPAEGFVIAQRLRSAAEQESLSLRKAGSRKVARFYVVEGGENPLGFVIARRLFMATLKNNGDFI